MARRPSLIVRAASLPSAGLRVVEVGERYCVLSTGEVLIVRWEKLRALCEQVCQDGWTVWIRTWITPDGNELIELHRDGVIATDEPTANSASSEVF
jgi:hypothetical protein